MFAFIFVLFFLIASFLLIGGAVAAFCIILLPHSHPLSRFFRRTAVRR